MSPFFMPTVEKGKGLKIIKVGLAEAVKKGLLPSDLPKLVESSMVKHILDKNGMLAGGALRRTIVRGSCVDLVKYKIGKNHTDGEPRPELLLGSKVAFDLDFYFESIGATKNAIQSIETNMLINGSSSSYYATTFVIPKGMSPYDGEIQGQIIDNKNKNSFEEILQSFDIVNCMLGITKTHFYYAEEAYDAIVGKTIRVNKELEAYKSEEEITGHQYRFRMKRYIKYLDMPEHRVMCTKTADFILTRILNRKLEQRDMYNNRDSLVPVVSRLIDQASLATLVGMYGNCKFKDGQIDLRLSDYRKEKK